MQPATHITQMELTVDQALQQGIAAHREGKLQDAERLYRAILQAQPKHPDANHNLGVLAVAGGKPLEAVPMFQQALGANPKIDQFWLSYIDVLITVERFDEAKHVLVEGEKSGVSSEKLDALNQKLQASVTNNTNKTEKDQTLSEKRKKLAEKKKSKKAKAQVSSSSAEPSQDQINRLVEHYQAGRLEETEVLATSLTQQFPKHAFAWKVLGVLLKETGRLVGSLLPMQKLLELSPKNIEAHYNLGNTLYELGRLEEAEESYKQAIRLKPDFAEAHSNLGVTFRALGKLEEAEASARRAIAVKPDYSAAYYNLGITLYELGRLAEAQASYSRAIALRPQDPRAHYNLGNTLHYLGRLEEAEESYKQAIRLKPDFAEAHSNLGNTLYELGRSEEAEESYKQAIRLKPDFAEAHSNLGVTFRALGKLEEAEASARRAIAVKPDYADAHLNLCDLLETANEIDKLFFALEKARSQSHIMRGDFLYFEALVSFRKEQYVEAESLISQIKVGDLSKMRKAGYHQLQGDLYNRRQDYKAAFVAYENKNRSVKDGRDYQRLKPEAQYFFNFHGDIARQLSQLSADRPSLPKSVSIKDQPIFLVGFPRSGTTLLDTVLRTHSKIDVVEERPMVAQVHTALGLLQDVIEIEAIDRDGVRLARTHYFQELAKQASSTTPSLIIDKLPLNLLHAPLINRIFPEAKFILALRHPLDCILSCWMQTFQLNAAMANMVDLDRIVDFYCVAMDIFHLSQKRYGLDVHRIRYEDLIEDFEAETTSILRFLGLEWESELVNYQATALARRKINTPSYSQVIKPIYKTASYRWKHYENHLEKYKPKLAPWFEEYGY